MDDERRHDLARTLSEVARTLQAEHDENQTLQGIVTAAVDTVPRRCAPPRTGCRGRGPARPSPPGSRAAAPRSTRRSR